MSPKVCFKACESTAKSFTYEDSIFQWGYLIFVAAIKGTRIKLDVNQAYTERNFITPIRAMTEYGLKLQDLEGLKKTLRRSPISDNPPITVFLRRDVETKCVTF